MTGSPSYAHIKADVMAVIASVPRGKVTTFAAIGQCLGVMARHVSTIVSGLDGEEYDAVPWHRVVAEGGAVGRHQRRYEQIARLRADGLVVSPAGIVAGLEHAMLKTIERPRSGIGSRNESVTTVSTAQFSGSEGGAGRPSRARGRFDRPGTKRE